LFMVDLNVFNQRKFSGIKCHLEKRKIHSGADITRERRL